MGTLGRNRSSEDAAFARDGVFMRRTSPSSVSWAVWRYQESQRIRTDFALPADTLEICLARCPDTPVWCGMELPKSTVVIHDGGKPYRTVLPAGAKTYGVVLSKIVDAARRCGLR